MIGLQKIVYSFGIKVFGGLIRIAALKNEKAKQWVKGRVDLLRRLEKDMAVLGPNRIWIHCASHGEFEQAKPIITALKERKPDCVILVSIFSPSGMRHAKNHPQVDCAFYLPLDTKSNAISLYKVIKPKVAIWIKYELWPHILETILDYKTPLFLVSAKFHDSHIILRNRGAWIKSFLQRFDAILTQDVESSGVLQKAGIANRFNGDTRIDQALAVVNQKDQADNWIPHVFSDKPIMVFGSIWESDWKIIAPVLPELKQSFHLLFAPHEIKDAIIDTISQSFESKEISLYTEGLSSAGDHMIINTIGRLAIMYRYADIAYVGGGFGKGLHNILEPTSYGKGIIIGGNIDAFPEAKKLVALGAAKHISTSNELLIECKYLIDEDVQQKTRGILHDFFSDSHGASNRIVAAVMPYL